MLQRSVVEPVLDYREWAGVEKRRSRRVQVDSPARLRVDISPLMPALSVDARVLSASLDGLQLQVNFIFPRTAIQVDLFNRVVAGKVRYCVADGDGFRIGVCLKDAL